jgi:hypothetical protein
MCTFSSRFEIGKAQKLNTATGAQPQDFFYHPFKKTTVYMKGFCFDLPGFPPGNDEILYFGEWVGV